MHDLTRWLWLTGSQASAPIGGGGGEVVPPATTTHPLAWRGDRLTFQRADGRVWYIGNQGVDVEACRLYREQGYTDTVVETVFPSDGVLDPEMPYYNFFDSGPASYVERAVGYVETGLRVICGIGFEDADAAWTKHQANWPSTLRDFIKGVDGVVSCYRLGVEVEEYWSWDEVHQTMRIIAEESARPIAVHFKQRKWGPDSTRPWHGGGQMAWWEAGQLFCPHSELGCAFQHQHDQPEHQRANGGFLSPESDIRKHVIDLNDPTRLGGIGVKMISDEYGYPGKDLWHPSVTIADTRPLGQLALSLGAFGFLNGG